MRLYYIANYRMPTERTHGLQVAKMCEAFVNAGASVTLVVPDRGDRSPDVFTFYGVKKSFAIDYLPVWDLTGKVPYLGFLIQSTSFAMNVIRYLRTLDQNAIVYSRDQFSLFLLCLLAQRKMIFEVHSLPRRCMPWHRLLWRRMYRIVAISRGVADGLVQCGVAKEKIDIAHDGVDDQFLRDLNHPVSRADIGLPSDKIIIMYTGSLMKWKGVFTLLDAAKKLPAEYHSMIIGGSQDDLRSLKAYCRDRAIDSVDMRPRVSHADIARYIQCADILVLPNSAHEKIGSIYTSPLKFFEYAATSKPIVLSDVPALHEVGDELTGVSYFTPDNAESLAQAIISVDRHGDYKRDVSRYTWNYRARYILDKIR